MTTELQHVMARYEEARIAYKKAVLASLNGAARGEGIRHAIRDFQQASAELRRLTGGAAHPRPAAVAPVRHVVARAPKAPERESVGAGFFRRLLSVG